MPNIPRLISMTDRNRLSPTHGCCDRLYWHYKTTDFPNARFQESALTLALLHKNNYPGNVYRKNKNVKSWILAALNFWAKIQHKDGSFDEAYPNEHSFVATAFSSYAVSEICILLNISDDRIIGSLKKAGEWLIKSKERHATNQVCGAIAALYNIYLLSKEKKFLSHIKKELEFVRKRQDKEGWFYEYGGPDFGYMSLAIDYLSKYYDRSRDKAALDMASRAIKFYRHFVQPNGSAGGEYGSRNTEYTIPSGFESFSRSIQESGEISLKFLNGLKRKEVISPFTLDDRYFAYNGYTYLQAFDHYKKKGSAKETFFQKRFPNSRLFVVKKPGYHCVIGFNKGGVFRIYTNDYVYSDSGFIGVLNNGDRISNQWLDKDYNVHDMNVSGNFHKIRYPLTSPPKLAASRLVLGLGRKRAGKYLKKKLRESMITKSPKVNIKFERSFEFGKHIVVRDRITGRGLRSLRVADKFSSIHVASSKYFLPQELCFDATTKNLAIELNKKGTANIVRTFPVKQ
jgi:hypothetical protein